MSIIEKLKDNFLKDKWKVLSDFFQNNLSGINFVILKNEKNQDIKKIKTMAFHNFLFRSELRNTMIFIFKNTILLFGMDKKINDLNSFKEIFKNSGFNLILLYIEKIDEISNKKLLDKYIKIDLIKNIGILGKEESNGDITDFINNYLLKTNKIDITLNFNNFFAVKLKNDINIIRSSANLNITIFKQFKIIIEEIFKKNKKYKHIEIAEMTENYFIANKKKIALELNLKEDCFDTSYEPIIQSGDIINLKLNAESDENIISDGIITASIGCKYHEIHCNIARTFIINKGDQFKKIYNLVFESHNFLIDSLKPKKIIKDVYNEVKNFIIGKYNIQEAIIPNNFGFGMGYEFKENLLTINKDNNNIIKKNMIFYVTMNFTNIYNINKTITLGDLIKINFDYNEVFTKNIRKKYNCISYNFNRKLDNNKEVEESLYSNNYEEELLEEKKERKKELELKIIKWKEDQKLLIKNKTEEIKERHFTGNFLSENLESNTTNTMNLACYNEINFPKNLSLNDIHFDDSKYCVLLPISNKIVPFHIIFFKNTSLFFDDNIHHLRINFTYPGISNNCISFPDFKTLESKPIFLKEVVFKHENVEKLNDISQKIKLLQKKFKLKEYTDILSFNNIKSEELKTKIKTLIDIKVKPNISGKKTIGNLIAFTNGFKFLTKKNEELIIASENIKHILYKECDSDMIVILHIHLFKKIIVGKKPTLDIQFYTEVGTIFEDLMDKKRLKDIDELQQDAQIANAKKNFNEKFNTFVALIKTNMKGKFQIEVPQKKLGFEGSVNSISGVILPTVNCLVNLEHPFFIVTLADIEIVSLERVGTRLKNFDMIIIFKNYRRPVETISCIAKHYLFDIKYWLKSINIPYIEGESLNLKWKNVLEEITRNPNEFIDKGCWEIFLDEDEEINDSVESNFSDDENLKKFDEIKKEDNKYLENMSIIDSQSSVSDINSSVISEII